MSTHTHHPRVYILRLTHTHHLRVCLAYLYQHTHHSRVHIPMSNTHHPRVYHLAPSKSKKTTFAPFATAPRLPAITSARAQNILRPSKSEASLSLYPRKMLTAYTPHNQVAYDPASRPRTTSLERAPVKVKVERLSESAAFDASSDDEAASHTN